MQSRSNVRTNAIVFSILGLVVGLLIHFITLSSSRYNWIDPDPAMLQEQATAGIALLASLL